MPVLDGMSGMCQLEKRSSIDQGSSDLVRNEGGNARRRTLGWAGRHERSRRRLNLKPSAPVISVSDAWPKSQLRYRAGESLPS